MQIILFLVEISVQLLFKLIFKALALVISFGIESS